MESDATLIVFNCGNYERIGFRHRGSQTLFLSNLINVSAGSNYGQIQIGLYMTILRDALDRMHLIKGASTNDKSKKKQSRYADADREYERPRTRLTTFREQQSEDTQSVMHIFHAPFNVPLILVLDSASRSWSQEPGTAPVKIWSVQLFGPYYSASDRTFGRKSIAPYYRGAKIWPGDYFHLTLTSEIAEGATGKVHDAKIEVQASDGRVYGCEAVVKVALGNSQRQRLRHEYAVYRYMALKKVNCVASVYGLFEDAADEATVLAMNHVGTSLAKQPHYREHWEVSLTKEQKYAQDIFLH